MKKLMVGVASVLMATSIFAAKLGYVDSQAVVSNFSETKKAQQSLEAQAKKIENEVKQKEVLLEKEQVALQAKGDKLTDAEKKAFEKKVQDFYNFVDKSQENLNKQQFEKLKKIDEIYVKAINKVGKDGKFDYILERDAIKFGGEDVTEKVLKAMETLK